MNEDQFYIILPSDSSMTYFPDNTITHYTTQLPQEIRLQGRWAVALTEIQFPRSFLHVRPGPLLENRIVLLSVPDDNLVPVKRKTYIPGIDDAFTGRDILVKYPLPMQIRLHGGTFKNCHAPIEDKKLELLHGEWSEPRASFFPPGLYTNIKSLVYAINNTPFISEHFQLKHDDMNNRYVLLEKTCGDDCELIGPHFLAVSRKISQILGFNPEELLPVNSYRACHPPSLTRGLPQKLFIYCDICEPRITGDVKTPLLRVVSVDTKNYVYGTTQVTQFSTPHYIPVLHTGFRTLEIDIRDNLGQPIPFDFGSLTVTLHFKRID